MPTQLLGTNRSSPAGWARGPRYDPPNSWGVGVGDPTSRPRPPSPASEFFPICHSHSQKHGVEAHLKLDLGQEGLIKKKKMDVLKTIYKNKFHLHLYFERATLSRDAKFKIRKGHPGSRSPDTARPPSSHPPFSCATRDSPCANHHLHACPQLSSF